MAIVRCSKGHYYDNVKFSQCPHCGIFAGEDDDDKTISMSMTGGALTGGSFASQSYHQENAAASGGNVQAKQREMDEEKTVAMGYPNQGMEMAAAMASATSGDEEKTISFYAQEKGTDFIVGWLVCVEGAEKGRDYRLHQGFNRLGRDYTMDIAVMEDAGISREAACAVVYDDRSNSFFAVQQPSGLAYLNGVALEGAKELKTGDMIRTGNSEFEFVGFCREGRTWK